MAPPFVTDPAAKLTLITGDDWAPWLIRAAQNATSEILLSVYMISPYWRAPGWTDLDMVAILGRQTARGLKCRAIVDQPNVPWKTRPFNYRAANQLEQAGWKVRVMPDARTLHEKIFLFDRELALIGSHNVSRASATSNYDTSVAIHSTDFADLVYRQFWQRWRLAKTLGPVAWQS